MDFTTSQFIQLIAAIALGIFLFVAVYRLPERMTIAILLILIPVQLVDSRYGTSNTVVTYLVAFAFILQGRVRAASVRRTVGAHGLAPRGATKPIGSGSCPL